MLERIKTMLIENCGQVPVVEFRQPYSSPVIAPYSNIVRASDCPADALTNRIRTIDERWPLVTAWCTEICCCGT